MSSKRDNLVVFDWNGTIVADTAACLNATNTVLKKLDLKPATIAQFRHHYTMPISKLYHALGMDGALLDKHEHIVKPLWHESYGAARLRLRRGARQMFAAMQSAACESIVVSNYTVNGINAQAQKFGVRPYFSDIIAYEIGDTNFRRKGKGARLKEYLQTKPARKAMIVGDSEEEVEIGRELGMTTVAITDGMCSTARLRAMKPDYLVRSLTQVPAIAQHLFGTTARVAL